MKQPKKATKDQKIMLTKEGLDPKEWMVKDEDKISVSFIHKTTKKVKLILK